MRPSLALRRPRNWPLLVGGAIVLLVLFVALFGPSIAPRDPLERRLAMPVGERFFPAPAPPFLTWEYPLGTDGAGRDVFSRILWGVRPTLLLVALAAAIRLLLGVTIGLVAGFSRGWAGRMAQSAIDAALAVPTLIAALIIIALLGLQGGLVVFLVGLALTGWGETARLVAEQTSLLREQPFIQAARAMGASSFHVLVKHTLRHITPLLGMLLAFEISATLLVTATLGFLGYFIGGGIVYQLDDTVVGRFTESPELGQMLGTITITLSRPWLLLTMGTTVFIIILGFTLLGEGLRRQVQHERQPGPLARMLLPLLLRLEERLLVATGRWQRGPVLAGVALLALIAFGSTGGLLWAQLSPPPLPSVAQVELPPTPGGHGWSGATGGPFGTRFVANPQLTEEPAQLWVLESPDANYTGGPAVAADGTIYITTDAPALHMINPDGSTRQEIELTDMPVGTPALSADGTIYLTTMNGALLAYAPDGSVRWQFQGPREATSGPVVGPDGTIVYTAVNQVQAVTADGQGRWISGAFRGFSELTPVFEPSGRYVFLDSNAFRLSDGALVTLPVPPAPSQAQQQGVAGGFQPSTYFVGTDGRSYYRYGNDLIPLQFTSEGIVMGTWTGHRSSLFLQPVSLGMTPDGLYWRFTTSDFNPSMLTWNDSQGAIRSEVDGLDSNGQVIGMDAANTAYICTSQPSNLRCDAIALSEAAGGPGQKLWQVTFEDDSRLRGGALTEGRLYVANERTLVAFGK
jgi:ABC-type dipeptide/oligopeptide/nickel transport system permease subunit